MDKIKIDLPENYFDENNNNTTSLKNVVFKSLKKKKILR